MGGGRGWAAFPGGTGPKGDAVPGGHFKIGKEQTRKTGRELAALENLVWMQTVLVPDHHRSPSFPRPDRGDLTKLHSDKGSVSHNSRRQGARRALNWQLVCVPESLLTASYAAEPMVPSSYT